MTTNFCKQNIVRNDAVPIADALWPFVAPRARPSPPLPESAVASSPISNPHSPKPSKPPARFTSANRQRLFRRLVRKFHEFVLEFDANGKVLSIWSSNGKLSLELRQGYLGRHLHDLVGRKSFDSLNITFRRVLRDKSVESFEFPAVLQKVSRRFEARISRSTQSSKRHSWVVLRVQDVTARHLLEERLHVSETMLENAEEIAEMGTWEHDLATGAVVWSKQLFRLHGMHPTRLPSQTDQLWRLLNFKNKERLRHDFELAVREGVPFRFSEPYTQPDGSVRILDGLGAPIRNSAGKITRVVGITRDITSQARTQANLRWLSHQLLTIRSEEQRRMGRELHETASQTLAALKMTLAQIGRSIPQHNNKVHKLVRSSADLANAAVREVRFVSCLLHPPLLEEAGLVTALNSYIKLFAERGGISVGIQIAESFGRLGKEIELTVFRIVQEALTNVHRHANATSANVRVKRAGGTVLVEIKDNGVGIFHVLPDSSIKVPLGVGIAGMRERVDQLRGDFEIISAPGEGTAIRASIPIPATEESRHERKVIAKRKPAAETVSNSRSRRSRRRPQGSSLVTRN